MAVAVAIILSLGTVYAQLSGCPGLLMFVATMLMVWATWPEHRPRIARPVKLQPIWE